MLLHGVSCAPNWESTKPHPFSSIFTKRCATAAPIYVNRETTVNGEVKWYALPSKVTATDVRVRVRSGVVTVQVEQAVVLVLVVVTATVQHDTTGVVVAVIQKEKPTDRREHRTTGAVAPKLCF